MDAIRVMSDRTSYQMVIPVWGEPYTSLCVDYLLPSLLAPGNLPALDGKADILITLCCPPETRAAVEAAPCYEDLSRLAEVCFLDNSQILADESFKYRAMSDSFYLAFSHPKLRLGDTVFLFINPDVIVSSETLTFVHEKLSAGAKAVLMSGLRVRMDKLPDRFASRRDGNALSISAWDLSRLALEIMHPITEAFIWNRGEYPRFWPSNVFYQTGDGSLLQHSFHLHPLALRCPESIPQTLDSIDGDFLELCGLGIDDVEIVSDGDGAVVVEISDSPYAYSAAVGVPSRTRLADFAVRHVSNIHWEFFFRRIAYGSGEQAPHSCSELDRILRYIKVHRPRRSLLKRFAWLDRRILRYFFYAFAWIITSATPTQTRRR